MLSPFVDGSMASRAMRLGCLVVLLAAVWGSLPVSAQTSSPPMRLIAPGGRVVFSANPAGIAPDPTLDPQTAAMMQQIGMDQSVAVTAEFDPPTAALGQPITYRVTVTAMVEGVSMPDTLPAPQGLAVALAGRGFNYGNMGVALQPRTTFNYRVTPAAAGTYTMPSFTASANGKPARVPQAQLTVVPAGTPGVREPLRLLAEVPSGDCYIGQAVLVRLVAVDTGGYALQALSSPQVAGDAVLSEPAINRVSRETRSVNGRMLPAVVTTILVYPIKEGRLEFVAQAYAYFARSGVSPGFAPMDTVLLNSDPVALTVKHLPKDGELPGFTGAIGTFQVDPARLSTNVVRAGEPLTLTVTVRGEGNLSRLIPPKLDRVRGWQVFAPMGDASGSLQVLLRGWANFTYTLIPLSDQLQATPSVPFSYFDPRRQAYVDATVPPAALRVLPSPSGPVPMAETSRGQGPAADDPDQPGVEREPVMTGLMERPGPVASSLKPLQARPSFLLLQLLPAAALGGLWFWDRRRRFLAAHPEVVLRTRARRRLRRHLRLLRRAAGSGNPVDFVRAGVASLRELTAPLEAANPDALVCADVLRALEPAERDGASGALVRTLFAAADESSFVDKKPDGAAILALRPQLETLLGQWRAKL